MSKEKEWIKFSELNPTPFLRIEAFHSLWKCVVAVEYRPDYCEKCPWMCLTKTNTWPHEAFSHYRSISMPPDDFFSNNTHTYLKK